MMTWLRKMIAAIVLIGFSCVAYADPPPQSGVVFRFDAIPWFQWWYDEENNTTAYFGVDPLLACTEPPPSGWELVPIMRVFMATDGDDILRFKSHVNGELQTSVWPGFIPPTFEPIGICPKINFFGLTPIATGWSHFRFNDNDVDPSLNPNRNNINSFGFNANGVLLNYATGEPMCFMMYFHGAWDGIDFDASFRFIMKTKLK